jgi:TRAP-type C4-dicarboxylate transport system substrate-binding protein
MKMRRNLVVAAIVSFVVLLFITFTVASGFAKSAKPITLNFVSFVPLANKVEYQFIKDEFFDKINERAKGELIIKTRGGPEVIAPFDLGVAVQKGTIDMATIPTAFFESMVPGADSTKLSIYTAWEERKNGIYEYIRDMYTKAGLYYLGRGEATKPEYFNMFINKRIEKPKDFAGLKLGGSTAFHGQYKRLGASVATLAIPEYHSAMERHVVDGLVSSIYVGFVYGLHEVTKYIIGHGFYRCTVAVPVNLKTWNRLPKHLQELLTQCMAEFEKKYEPYEAEQKQLALKRAKAAGVEILWFPPDMAKWYIECANEGSWDYARERFPGDVIPKLRDRITK